MSEAPAGSVPPPPGYYAQPPAPKGSNGLATAGFVLGLLGLLGSWIPLLNVVAILLAVIGIVLAGIGLSRSKKVGAGKGLAIAGLVLGVLAVVFAFFVNSVFVDAVDDATSNSVDSSNAVEAPNEDGAADSSDSSDEEGSSEDSQAGASRENPVPLGSKITGGDWTVSINRVAPVDADSIGSRAQNGSILLQVNLTATYNGDDPQGATPFTTTDFVTADGTTIDGLDGSTLFLADKEFDSLTTVYAGKSISGDRILEVPTKDWQQGVLAVSPDALNDTTFVAVK